MCGSMKSSMQKWTTKGIVLRSDHDLQNEILRRAFCEVNSLEGSVFAVIECRPEEKMGPIGKFYAAMFTMAVVLLAVLYILHLNKQREWEDEDEYDLVGDIEKPLLGDNRSVYQSGSTNDDGTNEKSSETISI